jgi:amino acid transporter
VPRTEALKRVFLGRPMASGELEHTLLPKTIALPVFSSDPLSSNAYATQEILLVLGLAGALTLRLVIPIAIAVATLLAIVVTSYRQTVHAYPTGGGAYRVSKENLGTYAGLTAAAALLTDYVLTVSVSVTAGVDAIVSAVSELHPFKIEIAVFFVLFVTLINLRGVKESGTFFAIPTYGFIAAVYLMIITGIIKCFGGCPPAGSATLHLEQEAALSAFLVLKAFAAGTTALTGVEAISDGVPAFRYPQSRNAAATLTIMGALSISMFLGISWLAHSTGVRVTEDSVLTRSVVADIAHTIFGGGFLFYLLQVMTAAILILAANTAYQDFPRLSSILAQDRFMPRQFLNRGDRLVFSNGVLILAVLATILVIAFDANLNRLIQLYLVGVFISFTLSQAGMFLRLRREKLIGWRRRAAVSGFGAMVTAVVFVVILSTKFAGGAWIVIASIPIIIYGMHSVRRHYDYVASSLEAPERYPTDRRPGHHNMLILVTRCDDVTARALGYVRSLRVPGIEAITFDSSAKERWQTLAPDVPLQVIRSSPTSFLGLRRYLRGRRRDLRADDFLTLVIPETLHSRSLFEIIRHPRLHRLKAALLREPGVQVLDIPSLGESKESTDFDMQEPSRNYAVVLAAGLHNGTLQAIEYAEALRPTSLTAVSFALDPDQSLQISEDWLRAAVPHPLVIEDSPFRDIASSLREFIRQYNADGVGRVVTVILPEFVVDKKRHQILHGQTALLIKRHLLFEPGVVTVSVPYYL